jgi:NADP-dependent 3-hydroxy acid dehydrogenase YdfG
MNMIAKKVALATGVSSGIGRSVAIALAERGFRTFGTVRLTSDTGDLPDAFELVRLDVRDEESIDAALQQLRGQAETIDVLVNSAGYILLGSLEETSIPEARQIFETNFFGVLRMCRRVLPTMRRRGTDASSISVPS